MSEILSGSKALLRLFGVTFALSSIVLVWFGFFFGEWWLIYISGFTAGLSFEIGCLLFYNYLISRRYDKMWSKYNNTNHKNK